MSFSTAGSLLLSPGALVYPPRHYQPILRKLKVSVLTPPVLIGPTPDAAKALEQGGGNFGLYLPATKEGTWSWVEQQKLSGANAVDWTKTSVADIHSVSDKNNRSYSHLSVREGWLLYDRNANKKYYGGRRCLMRRRAYGRGRNALGENRVGLSLGATRCALGRRARLPGGCGKCCG